MKALEILKKIKYDYSICDNNMVLDNNVTNVLVDEAIKELEAIQDIILEKDESLEVERFLHKQKIEDLNNRRCSNCKYVRNDTLGYNYCNCAVSPLSSCIFPLHPGFCCNKWESK